MAAIYSKLLGIEQKQDQSATLQGETRASVREVRIKLGPGQAISKSGNGSDG